MPQPGLELGPSDPEFSTLTHASTIWHLSHQWIQRTFSIKHLLYLRVLCKLSGGWEDVRDEKTCSVRKPAGLEDLRNRSNSRTRRPARWVDLQVKRVQVFSFRGSERTNADLSFGSRIFGSGCISNIVLGKFGRCCCYASHLGHQTHEQGLVITLQRECKIILRSCKSDRVNSITEVFFK